MKCKFHIPIAVEVSYSVSNIFLLKLSIAVFAQVLTYLPTVKEPQALSVDPLK